MPQVGRSAIRMEQVIEPVANRVRTDIERCAKLRLHRIGGVPTHQYTAARQAGQQHQADQSDQAYAKRHDTFPLHCAPSHCTGQQFRETFSRKTGTCAIASPGSRRPNPTSSRATEGSWCASRADHRGGHDPCVRRRDRTDGDADATAGHGTASRRGGRRVATDRLGVDRNSVPAETHVLDSGDLRREGAPNLLRSLNQQVGGVTLEFGVGQSLPADLQLSRLRRVATAGHAAGPRRLRQRHALQPAVRRHGGLGPDPEHRHRPPEPRRVQSGVRSERARRLDQRPAEERLHLARRRAQPVRRIVRPRSGRVPMRQAERRRCRPTSPGRCCTRTAGATCSRPTCRTSMAISAGAASTASCISTSPVAHSELNGPGTSPVQLLAVDPAAQFTAPNFDRQQLHGRQSQRHRRSQRYRFPCRRLAYYRYFLQNVSNGNAPNDTPCTDDDLAGLLCAESGVSTTFGGVADPGLPERRAVLASSTTRRPTRMPTAPRSRSPTPHDVFGLKNHFVAGLAFDGAQTAVQRRVVYRRADAPTRGSSSVPASSSTNRAAYSPVQRGDHQRDLRRLFRRHPQSHRSPDRDRVGPLQRRRVDQPE